MDREELANLVCFRSMKPINELTKEQEDYLLEEARRRWNLKH